jgi:asparagine synthase (glutamine-hydrolysing)
VTVAAYLSGGLDSSTTTALIKKIMPDTLQTFSIGFEDEEFDETPFQQEVASYLDTRHTAFTCTRAEIGELFPRIIWHSEIPVLRTAPVPMFCLSKKVRESGIKVVITGEGADEMFAGYDIFKEGIIREFWARQPESVYRPLLFRKLYPYLAQFKGRDLGFLKLFYGYRLKETDSPFYSHLLRWHNTSGIRNFLLGDFKSSPQGKPPFDEVSHLLPDGFDSYGTMAKSQWLESVIFMSGYLLSSQGDRMGMANSVEGRYPFLDYRVIEFAASLPPDFKMKGLDEKYIMKKMMDNRLPDSVLKRPKQAYRAPGAGSFFSQGKTGYADDLLSESGLRKTGIFDPAPVQRLLHKVKSGQMASETDNMALSGILSTQILIHQFILKDDFLPGTAALEDCRIYRENALYQPDK